MTTIDTLTEDRVCGSHFALRRTDHPFYLLRTDDLVGQEHVVRVLAVEERAGDILITVQFRYAMRVLRLDGTNKTRLEGLFGGIESSIGKHVVLYPDQDVIRLKAPAERAIRRWDLTTEKVARAIYGFL